MSFCGQCGLLLTTKATRCPRCGAEVDLDPTVISPGISADDNSATVIEHKGLPGQAASTPSSSSPVIPFASGMQAPPYNTGSDRSIYPEQRAAQSEGLYPTPRAFPGTDPNYSFHTLPPPRKAHRWPIVLLIVLIMALLAATVMFFALGPNSFAIIFGPKSTPQTTPAVVATQQEVPTPSATSTTTSLQIALSTIQQYYDNINNQNYQAAYNLWFNNPDNYAHFKQGFANTQRDDITLGDAISQVDGTVRVNLTVKATQTTAGGGTQLSTYGGYYTVGQQADGSWKIINGSLSPV